MDDGVDNEVLDAEDSIEEVELTEEGEQLLAALMDDDARDRLSSGDFSDLGVELDEVQQAVVVEMAGGEVSGFGFSFGTRGSTGGPTGTQIDYSQVRSSNGWSPGGSNSNPLIRAQILALLTPTTQFRPTNTNPFGSGGGATV